MYLIHVIPVHRNKMAKYKFVNGVMVKQGDAPTKGTNTVPLAIVATPEDIAEASQVQPALVVPQATQEAINEVTEESFISKFKCREDIDEEEIMDRLSFLFATYEVPIGLLRKLIELTDYSVNIILDDSGSMAAETDSTVAQAGPFMVSTIFAGVDPKTKMTRWQEQEDRLHVILDFLGCIPTGPVRVSFMNRHDKFILEHKDITPTDWINKAHQQLRDACKSHPSGGTPTYEKLKESFDHATGNTMHYLFTDGVPNGGPEQVSKLIVNRSNPRQNPLTLVSCTNVDSEAEWMKQIEEDGPFVSETDDFADERDEVNHDQGAAFPYTKGLWLLCLLVGAINPYDLDALDDTRPLSKFTLDNIMGRATSPEEYKKYWDSHPRHSEQEANFIKLSTEQKHTEQILGKANTGALGKSAARFKSFGI